MEKLEYTEQITLLPSQFDFNDNLSPTAIMGLFQDIASLHAEKIGIGFENMLKKDLYWVLIRSKYDVIQQPKPYQKVILKTWPHLKGRVDFDRDYILSDLNGNVLIKGTSKWCVISTKTRKLMLPTYVDYPADLQYLDEVNYTDKFAKTPTIEISNSIALTHKVAFHEIDHNKHLNNVHYATYVYDCLQKQELKHLQLNYISECRLGDDLDIYVQESAEGYLVAGYVGQELKFTALAF